MDKFAQKLEIWRLLLCFFITMPSALALERGGLASVTNFANQYFLQASSPDRMLLSADPAGSNAQVYKLTLFDSDLKSNSGYRTEIGLKNEYVKEGGRWYAFGFYIAKPWDTSDVPIVMAQLHTSQKTLKLSPPLSIVARGDSLYLTLYGSHKSVDADEPPSINNAAKRLVYLGPVVTQQWLCFVISMDWSHTPGQGGTRVWMNKRLVYQSENDLNSFDTWLGNYLKVGLYAPWKFGASFRQVYVDALWASDATADFDSMYRKTICGTSGK